MTDAFNDVISDDGGEATSNEVVTDSTFTDAVRTTLPDDSEMTNDEVYSDPDGDGEADDVDPRKLFRQTDVNELRYYARENPYGRAIVHQPIRDAFKHGFEIEGDYTEDKDGLGKIEKFLKDEYVDYAKLAFKKARRDGLALLLFKIKDGAKSASYPIPNTGGTHDGFELYTLDNLSENITAAEVAEYTEYDQDNIYITEGAEHGGIALVDNIGHPDNGDVIGYGIHPRQDREDASGTSFVHADRVQPFTHGEHVDGELGTAVDGSIVGESALTPVLQPIKATQMGFWAMKNILFRYSAPLHAVEPPESWSMDDFEDAREKMEDLSMASDGVLPPGASLEVAEGVSEFDPNPVYDTVVESICAGTVFTKSVLQGTQTGTVSGSETDLKGYFSAIHLLRQERFEAKFHEAVEMVNSYDKETIPNLSSPTKFDISWGPMFKPTDIEQMEGAISLITAATNGIKNYVLTPDEARSLVDEEWAKFDLDVDLDELSEDEWDALDRINIRETGQLSPEDEPDMGGTRKNPRLKNGGGQPQGQTRESSQPTRTTTDSLTDELTQFFVDANYNSGDIVATPDGIGVVSGTLTQKVEDLPGTDKVVHGEDKEINVVGFGGKFGLYHNETLDALDVAGPDELRKIAGTDTAVTDGETIYTYDGDENVVVSNLPTGWDEYSLLSWWAGVGGEWDEARDALMEQRDISKETATSIASNYKQMVLGTTEQVQR